MAKWILGAVTLLIIIAAIVVVVVPAKAPTEARKAQLDDLIVVDSPVPGAAISSPVTITGRARGTWYFEASFPVRIVDGRGNIIAQGAAHAQSDWMTEEYVPFTSTLSYVTPTPGDPALNRGAIMLRNDNPSGDPARDKALEVPVVFK